MCNKFMKNNINFRSPKRYLSLQCNIKYKKYVRLTIRDIKNNWRRMGRK